VVEGMAVASTSTSYYRQVTAHMAMTHLQLELSSLLVRLDRYV
jgi:hypothetical protein